MQSLTLTPPDPTGCSLPQPEEPVSPGHDSTTEFPAMQASWERSSDEPAIRSRHRSGHSLFGLMAKIPPPPPLRIDHYSAGFKQSAERLAAVNPAAWAGLQAAIQYLLEFQREAVAPDVRWHIVASEYGKHCGEIRWPNPEAQFEHPNDAWRGLFVAHPDNNWYVFTVLGNKAGTGQGGNTWYTPAVQKSDAITHAAIETLGLADFPTP